ncbi:TetR family transcriptional regulator [Virgisporangium aliadipatigenens]|uniref:TetR family transcriptional regulator n=1 Tax=Virgisporangium aliadipatigenens TaxID=741659 RepID=A0A8J3YRM1_9ACTN|nr:helix-turn-helix domain-containing protein [Virgisporangium aliadipatigenens]GIJ50414.1 TetR family transcriptional regulator [Virgisporangium aliadipatigenens]
MPRPRTTETADRIRAAALELIAEKGVQQTSLREIAERVGITKPALYYHFASREELVRSLVRPLIDDVEAMLAAADAESGPRALLGAYFDVTYRNRHITQMIMRDLSVLALVDLTTAVATWRGRLVELLIGKDPTLAQQARAWMAIGGMDDCTAGFRDVPKEALREAVLDAALATLGR